MIDELKSNDIIQKVGGKFKLTALVQRRMSELLQGSRPMIDDTQDRTLLEIAIQEIIRDKVVIEGSAADTDAQKANE
jgi:DNA-directed RNA polymerase subunit omega